MDLFCASSTVAWTVDCQHTVIKNPVPSPLPHALLLYHHLCVSRLYPPHTLQSPASLLYPSLTIPSQLVCERKKAETEELRSQVQQLVRSMEEERKAKATALGALMADLEVHGASG